MSNKIIKTAVSAALAMSMFSATIPLSSATDYGWATVYLNFCQQRGIICGNEMNDLMPNENLTREQMVKILIEGLSVDMSNITSAGYDDVSPDRWSYWYILKYQEFAFEKTGNFNPTEQVTREEFLAMTMLLAGFGDYIPLRANQMELKFSDCNQIDKKYYKLIATGFEKNCITGSDGMIKPKELLTRAEACAMLYRVIFAVENSKISDQFYDSIINTQQNTVVQTQTQVQTDPVIANPVMLVGQSEATLEQAKAWATKRGAAQIYIDIADLYWEYGELTGIRADVLYAQAAKETNFGKYTGQVKPEQNNWAGIKKYGATGDEPEDHEDFATPDDGVRGHFNHMCAYVGLEPVGEPHGRYKSVKSLSWAGTVKSVQQLGGKWCPNIDYGNSIIRDYLEPMKSVSVN